MSEDSYGAIYTLTATSEFNGFVGNIRKLINTVGKMIVPSGRRLSSGDTTTTVTFEVEGEEYTLEVENDTDSSSKKALVTVAIVVIVIGPVFILVSFVFLLHCLLKKHLRSSTETGEQTTTQV